MLKDEIPALVVGWAKVSDLEPSQKKAKLKEMAAEPRTLIFYEAPHRVAQVGMGSFVSQICLSSPVTDPIHTTTHTTTTRRSNIWPRWAMRSAAGACWLHAS